METVKETSVKLEPLAQPLRAHIDVEGEKLEGLINDYWDLHKDQLIAQVGYKGKKEKGGSVNYNKARKAIETSNSMVRLYGPVLVEYASDQVEEGTGEKVLLANTINISTDGAYISFDFYKQPSLNLEDPKVISELALKDPGKRLLVDIEEQLYDTLRLKLTDYKPSDKPIAEEDSIAYSIHKGKPVTAKMENLPEGYREVLLGLTKGDTAIVPGEKTSLKVVDVLKPVKLSKEELIEKSDLADADELTKQAEDHILADYENQRGMDAWAAVIDKIVKESNMEPIPEMYIERAAANFIKQHLARFGGDSKLACEAANVDNEMTLLQSFKDQVLGDVVRQMAIACYLKIHDLPEDIKLEDLSAHMADTISWTD